VPGALGQDVALDARRNRRPHLPLTRPPPTTPGHLAVAFSESSTDARAPSRSQPGLRRYLLACGASPLSLSHSGCPGAGPPSARSPAGRSAVDGRPVHPHTGGPDSLGRGAARAAPQPEKLAEPRVAHGRPDVRGLEEERLHGVQLPESLAVPVGSRVEALPLPRLERGPSCPSGP
jgi:hypothetical protein